MNDKEFIRRLESIRTFARKIVGNSYNENEYNYWLNILNGISNVIDLIQNYGIKDFNQLIKEKRHERC